MTPSRARKISSLQDHPESYVTTAELAEYWLVSRKQIYKQIDAGTLRAIRLGPRLLRISKADALDFERRGKMAPSPASPPSGAPPLRRTAGSARTAKASLHASAPDRSRRRT